MAVGVVSAKDVHEHTGVHQKKRIIVCCDGTWVDSDNGYDAKTCSLKVPSNVTRFVRSIRTESWPKTPGAPNVPQIAYYQAGVGSGISLMDQLGGGATGEGIDENIREAYSFVTRNWIADSVHGDDELYFLGFSRGAFTARCIVGFISTVGLLTKRGMDFFPEIFKDYEHMNVDNYTNPLQLHSSLKGKPRLIGQNAESLKRYVEYLQNPPKELGLGHLTSSKIPTVNALGVWDTVGSLGVPGIAVIDEIKSALQVPVYRKELQFYDTSISANVENAFQALALDEMRYSFVPCLWEKTGGVSTKLKQVWFPGVHSNIGGGMDDIELSDITLAWMLSQFDSFLDFDDDYIIETFRINKEKAEKAKKHRAWSCGVINTSDNSPIYKISGFRIRHPGQYVKSNNHTGEQIFNDPLENTNERIHPSVRLRLASAPENLGINDEGIYQANALTHEDKHLWNEMLGRQHVFRAGWKLVKNDPANPVKWNNDFTTEKDVPLFYWKCEKEGHFPDIMVEETLGVWEKKLLMTQKPEVQLMAVPKGWLFGETKV